MRSKFVVLSMLLTLSLAPLAAQVTTPQSDPLRGRIADAFAKGDTAAAEKMFSDPAVAKAVAPAGGLTTYEQIRSCGFYPQETRLACAIEIKQPGGYGGPIGSFGSFEYVAFYVDWQSNGFQASDYVGAGIVHITDGSAGTNFAAYRDFNPPGGPRTSNGGGTAQTVTNGPTLKARAILSWGVPTCGPNAIPYWGNVFDFAIRLMPIR